MGHREKPTFFKKHNFLERYFNLIFTEVDQISHKKATHEYKIDAKGLMQW